MMEDRLRVTVVATGIGREAAQQLGKPEIKLVNQELADTAQMSSDYSKLDRPTVLRAAEDNNTAAAGGLDEDYLDIPAFLRRQAD